MHICSPWMHMLPVEIRRGHPMSWGWSDRWLWITMRMLGVKLSSLQKQQGLFTTKSTTKLNTSILKLWSLVMAREPGKSWGRKRESPAEWDSVPWNTAFQVQQPQWSSPSTGLTTFYHWVEELPMDLTPSSGLLTLSSYVERCVIFFSGIVTEGWDRKRGSAGRNRR